MGEHIQKFPVADRTVKMIVPMMTSLSLGDGVRRRRKKPTLTLVRQRAIRHNGWVMKLRCRPVTMLDGGSIYCTWRPAP